MPPRVSITAGPPGQDIPNRWQFNDLAVENTRVQNLNAALSVELRALKVENTSLTARLRASKDRERALQRELVEKDAIFADLTAQVNGMISAVERMMIQMDENGDHGEGNEVDGGVGSEVVGVEFAGNGGNGDDGSNNGGGVGSNEDENNPALARIDEMLKIQGGMLKQMVAMQTEAAKGKQYPKWRNWNYWRRKLVVAAPAGIWMLVAGYVGNLLAGYTGVYLYPKK